MKRLVLTVAAVVLLAVLVRVLMAIFSQGPSTYPVRVGFQFKYDGKPVETSYLTTVRKTLEWNEAVGFRHAYTHGRDRKSFPLPDGSLILLSPGWLRSEMDKSYLEMGKSYTSQAAWMWQDSSHQPTQIVSWNGYTTRMDFRFALTPFRWLKITATIEPLDRSHLSEALRADAVHDDLDKIENSSLFGGSSNTHGTLFLGLLIFPLAATEPTEIEQLKRAPGWIKASGDCRFKPIGPHDAQGLTNWPDRVGLLRDGSSWSGEGGPLPEEPDMIYSTEKQVGPAAGPPGGSFSLLPFRSLAISMVHAVKWDGTACSGIEPPDGSENLLVQFRDGRLALIVPSYDFAVLGD